MLFFVGNVGEPIGYVFRVFPLVEFCLRPDFRVYTVENMLADFTELIRQQVGWLAKLSLWSFRVIKACCFAIRSVRLSMSGSFAMDFACESIVSVASALAFLQVVVMPSLRSLSCCVLSSV